MFLTCHDFSLLPLAIIRKIIYSVVIFVLTCLTTSALAQNSASASISLVARLPGSITLSIPVLPVAVTVHDGIESEFTVPLSVVWNLDPRETQSFQVIGHFRDATAALSQRDGQASIPVWDLIMQSNRSEKGRTQILRNAEITLLNLAISTSNRRSEYYQSVKFKIDSEILRTLPEGIYTGVLSLEVREY